MISGRTRRIVVLHLAIIGLLFVLQFVLPAYHHTNLARIMVLATFAMGYNILFGYTGLMSLGHAMFFAAGMYGAGLCVYYLQFGAGAAFVLGILAGVSLAAVFGLFALRTTGVSFLIVTMMFGQACYLTLLYFNEITLGDQGFTVSGNLQALHQAGVGFAYSDPDVKFNAAWLVFAGALSISTAIAASPIGRVLIAVRVNEERTRLLGYNTFAYKWLALCVSGAIAGAAGAAYALLFSYVGASFASILYSIYPLLWTLLGGAGTTLGPLVGTGVMFYLIDLTSGWTAAYLFIVGGSLLALVLWFPQGLMGAVRARWARWLP
ncbi:MAG: branched-chain amino acid ABC transporter permease [Gammaproteobacteria bacterium]|nr:branched-chain amino acid ABC transporter permease [Gammaproteobacteria bacterium]